MSANSLVYAFEHCLEELVHAPEFVQVEILRHRAEHRRASWALGVTVDFPGGVDIALCARVAAFVNGALETQKEPYTLDVESAGLERPLLRPADYERFAGKKVRIVTTLTISGAKTHRGTLRGLRGTAAVLDLPDGERLIPVEVIKSANLEYDPRSDLTRDKRERKQHA